MTNTIPNEEDAVKCTNEETQENVPVEATVPQNVSVTVSGFSLFATTLNKG
jgi:hypothetical protein